MGQFQLLSLGLGFIGPSMGLSFTWTFIAGLLGSIFGTALMALHATQGPVMGLPQMIQSRAQFGFRGVIIPVVAAIVDYVGYNIVCAVIIATGINALFQVNPALVVVIAALITGFFAIYGYDWVHRFAKVLFWIGLPVFAILTIGIALDFVPSDPATATAAAAAGFTLVAFGTQFAAAACNGIAFAPLVSDFSRYLKRDTPVGPIFGAMFLGATVSSFWMLALGAWLATHLGATDPVAAVYAAGSTIHPSLGILLGLVGVGLTLIVVTMNNYSASLSLMTVSDSFKPTKPTKGFRAASVIFATIVWALFAMAGGQDLIGVLWLTLTVLLYVLVPWSAINLVDFFFIRHGHYAITEIFNPNGIYQRWAWRGLLSYAIGIASMIPFAVLPGVYTGPLAEALGGIDAAWVVGLIVPAIVYRILAPSVAHEAQIIAASERQLEGGKS
jgi:purine-cytosine permease-like protein